MNIEIVHSNTGRSFYFGRKDGKALKPSNITWIEEAINSVMGIPYAIQQAQTYGFTLNEF